MEFIKILLGLLFRLAIAAFVIALVAWLVTAFFPQFTPKNIPHTIQSIFGTNSKATSTKSTSGTDEEKEQKKDWLPAPGSWKMLATSTTPNATSNLYVHGEAYSGTAGTYGTTYTSSTTEKGDKRELYLRNLSLPSYGFIYSGMTIIGEAKESMFNGGRFPIILIDNDGKSGIIGYAEATSNWAIPGWVRFEAKITSRLPRNTACTLLFRSADAQMVMKKNIEVFYPVQCN